jgi:peptidoglycan/xylan/chitin deacetylase (PgdA/CDA1 family)
MRRLLQRLRRVAHSRSRPLILMYHRVAAPAIDPWGLAVHPDRFEAHLDVLRRRRIVLSVGEIVSRLKAGTLPDKAVAITFDDGYVDNLTEAQPRLAAHGMSATLFLTAGAVGQQREFWWDELARAIFVNGARPSQEDATWRAWQEPRTDRQRAYFDLWQRLRGATAAERDESMTNVREDSSLEAANPADLPLSPHQVGEIVRAGVFELGGHTLTHPVLPLLDSRQRRFEVARGKQCCEELSRRPIAGFAYPHGAVDGDSRAAVRESGFSWACTTAGTPILPDSDVFALPRLFVPDCDASEFERAIA